MNATRNESGPGTGATAGVRRLGRLWIGLLAVAAIPLLGACEPQTDAPGEGESPEMGPAEEERDTMAGEAPMTRQEQQEQQRRTAERTALAVETLDGDRAYVTDGTGRALYILEGGDDPSTCTDECVAEWPPFAAMAGEPGIQGQELDEQLLGTVERPDGAMQITYDGHPLYYYHEDSGPGDTAGQNVEDQWGHWYLIGPDGQPVEEESGTGGR